jgi:hypothetical protein
MLGRYLIVLVATVAVLFALNVLPSFLGGEPLGVVRYPSVAAVEASYGVHLWTPASAERPPVGARVAVGHQAWVQFRVVDGRSGTSVEVCQTLPPLSENDSAVPAVLLQPGQVLQAADAGGNRARASLLRVMLGDGTIVNEMSWRRGAGRVVLRTRGSAEALLRLAGSR